MATRQDLWFSTKDTIAKVYDGKFKAVFEEVFADYEAKFQEAGITYFYTLIDDAVARVIRSKGGFIWACKNYDERRHERHGLHGLRVSGHDDLGAGGPRRHHRV